MRRRAALGSFWLAAAALMALTTPLDAALRPPALKSSYKSSRTATPTTSTPTTTTEPVTPSTTTTINPKENDADKAASESSDGSASNGTKPAPQLTGIPQKDYIYDPNLPRELNGADLTDYPFYSSLPENITFPCDGLKDGFYASVVHKCQVYHHCLFGTRYDFLCANYTAFDQRTFICHFVSEVDCENSPKYFDRNEALYKATTTTTIAPLTPPPRPPAPQREGPRRAPPRRRRPMRKRRPVYEYYYDDDYDSDDYYEDEPAPPPPPAPHKSRRRKRPRPPPEPVEDPIEDEDDSEGPAAPSYPPEPTGPVVSPKVRVQGSLPLTPSVYERPRAPPRIRRPVPLNERDKYEYTPSSGKAAEPAQPATADKQQASAAADDDFYDEDDPTAEGASPASSSTTAVGRNRPPKKPGKRRPADPAPVEDTEEEEDYEEPPRRPSRPSHGGRRRKHRNRPGVQPSAPAAPSTTTRRPKSTTPKPADDEEYYDDEEDIPESPPARRPSPSTTTTTTTTTPPPPPPRRSSHKSRPHKRKPTTAAPPTEEDEEYYDDEPIVSSSSTKAPTTHSLPSFRPRSRPSTTPVTSTSTSTTTTTTTEEPPPEEPEPSAFSQAPRNGRRPFLPSRGGSASLPRGLQPLGSKAKTVSPAPVTTTSTSTLPPPEIETPRVHKRPPPTPFPSIASVRDVIEPVTYRATAPGLDALGYRSRLPASASKHRGSAPADRIISDDTSKYSIRPYKSIGDTTLPPTPAPQILTTTQPPPQQISDLSKDDFEDYDEYENDALHPPLTAPKAIPSVFLPYRQLRSQATTSTAVKAVREDVRPVEADIPAIPKRGSVHYQAVSSASHQTPVRTSSEPQRTQAGATLVAIEPDDFRPAVLYSPKETPYQAYIADLRQQQHQHQQLVQQYQQQQMRRYQFRQPSSAEFYSTY